jgi:hypothetical protein
MGRDPETCPPKGAAMGTSHSLRNQHVKLTEHLDSVRRKMGPSIDSARAKAIRGEITRMAGLLNFHLSMEDRVVFPRLLRHENGQVASMAKRLSEDMEGLKGEFSEYRKRWLEAGAIESRPEEFTMDTNLLFLALGTRILREDRELYPVVEFLGM